MNVLTLLTNLEQRPFIRQILLQYILFMVIYFVLRVAYLFLSGHKWSLNDGLKYFVCALYFNFVLALTLTPLDINFSLASMVERIQLVPFDTVSRFWPLEGEYSLYNIVGNFLMMFPLFPVLQYSFGVNDHSRALRFTALFIIAIEFLQLVLTRTRALDIDDFILNFGGFCVSLFIWRLIERWRKVKLAN
jgi:glycopeptide antibiotics resistance protein